jgi:hypothetical protein
MNGGTVYSEMARLYYLTLGNKSPCDPALSAVAASCVAQAGFGMLNQGPFTNVTPTVYASPGVTGVAVSYWYGLEYAPSAGAGAGGDAWIFYTGYGDNNWLPKSGSFFGGVVASYAVAVRPGDVATAVPEPQTWVMLLMGFGTVATFALRRR